MRRLFACFSLLLAVLALASASCGGGSAPVGVTTLDAAMQRGAYGVGVTTLDLVDRSRGIEANRDAPALSERKLTTEVWYPADPSVAQPGARDVPIAHSDAPYPLIIFAHGLSSTAKLSASYTQHLASHGYIVAAPDFPLSNLTTPGGARIGAVIDQPKDVSFVIDSLLQLNKQSGHLLEGAIDERKIGITGHSLGALTTMLTIYGKDRDPRIKAALPISTPACFLPDTFAGAVSIPVLLLWGSRDRITPPTDNVHAYELANAPKYRAEIAGADHTRFVDFDLSDDELVARGVFKQVFGSDITADALRVAQAAGGDLSTCSATSAAQSSDALITGERQREILRTVAVPFFDAYLRGSSTSRDLLQKLPDQIPELHLESKLK